MQQKIDIIKDKYWFNRLIDRLTLFFTFWQLQLLYFIESPNWVKMFHSLSSCLSSFNFFFQSLRSHTNKRKETGVRLSIRFSKWWLTYCPNATIAVIFSTCIDWGRRRGWENIGSILRQQNGNRNRGLKSRGTYLFTFCFVFYFFFFCVMWLPALVTLNKFFT